ncbi:MAG: hypothetical protein EA370_08190 [Wenzhouxiangella sp.]|nr:MAG: hypothetical protein EA370_08190 [Wenzhouxiangella sp.]
MNEKAILLMALAGLLVAIGLAGCDQGHEPTAATVQLDSAAVPEHLRPALPMARQFGFADGGLRADALDRASPSELEELLRIVRQHGEGIDRWLDSFPPDADISDEAAAMMYMLLAHEELGL